MRSVVVLTSLVGSLTLIPAFISLNVAEGNTIFLDFSVNVSMLLSFLCTIVDLNILPLCLYLHTLVPLHIYIDKCTQIYLHRKIKSHVKLDIILKTKHVIMDTTINQRIKEIADKLCDGNVSELARTVGVNQPALRDVVGSRQVEPRFETLSRIADCATLNIDSEWLLTGKGEMQRHQIEIIHNPPYRDVGRGIIPVYDINAAANLQTIFANENAQHLLGEIKIPNAPDCDGAIYVRGDSMYPLIKSGDLVAYKELNSIESVISGEMFVVDFQINGDDFLVVKYVQKEDDNYNLRLVSYNQHHKDIVIPRNAVRAIALVKIISRITSSY